MPNKGAGNGGVTGVSPNEWPTTYHAITGITNARHALVTAVSHGITVSSTQSTPRVDFSQVKGMSNINGQSAFVLTVPTVDTFTIDLDTSQYPSYTSGGFINVLVGPTPIDPLTNTYA